MEDWKFQKRVEKKKMKKNFIQRHWTDWITCQIELLDILSLYTRNASNMYEHWAAAAAVAEAEERHHRNISCVCALLWFEYINCLLNDLINFFRRLKGSWCNVDGLMLVCVFVCEWIKNEMKGVSKRASIPKYFKLSYCFSLFRLLLGEKILHIVWYL